MRHIEKLRSAINRFGGDVADVDTNGEALNKLYEMPICTYINMDEVKLKVFKPLEGKKYTMYDIYANSPDGFLIEIEGLQGVCTYRSDGSVDVIYNPIGQRGKFCEILCEVLLNDPEQTGKGNLVFAPVDKVIGPIGFTAEQIETIKSTIETDGFLCSWMTSKINLNINSIVQ